MKLFLCLELTAILHEVALRQLDFTSDRSAHVVDDAAQVTIGNVGLNDDASLNIFAVDGIRALIHAHFGDLRDRNAASLLEFQSTCAQYSQTIHAKHPRAVPATS